MGELGPIEGRLMSLTIYSMIAIMFAKLRMSVEEASEEFATIFEAVYKSVDILPLERSKILRKCVEDILKRKGYPMDLPLVDDTQKGGCARSVSFYYKRRR